MAHTYAIVSGEYSDYEVHSIWMNKEAAEGAAVELNKERPDHRVATFPLEPAVVMTEYLEITCRWGSLHHLFSGRAQPFDLQERVRYTEGSVPECRVDKWHGSLTVRGTDFERVRKVASEQRAMAMLEYELNGLER